MNKHFLTMNIVSMLSFAAISFVQSSVYAGVGDNITGIDEIVPGRQEDSIDAKNPNDISIVLENVESAGDKTIFQVSLRCNRPNTRVAGPWNVQLTDEDGLPYPVNDITPETMNSGETRIYQTLPFTGAEHLTLSLVVFPNEDLLPLFEDFSGENLGFTFDPGNNSQPDQTWKLDESVQAGSFTLHVVRAALTAAPGLVFEFEPAEDVTGAMVYTSDPLLRGSTGGVPVQKGNFTAGMTFKSIPTEPFQVVISRVYYNAKGPWQIQWQPSAAPTVAPNASAPTARPTLMTLPTPTLAISEPLLLDVQRLARKFDAPFQSCPGWIHVINETITTPRAGQSFPPAYLKSELWYEIDAEGYVIRNVWFDYDKDGQIIQQTASVGDYSVNFTIGNAGFNNGTRYHFSSDMLSQDMSNAIRNNEAILQEETSCEDGQSCLLITLFGNFMEPIQNPGESQAFSGSGHRVWIDQQTGQQIKTQSFWRLADGSEVITSTKSTILVEKLDTAPQDILGILERVIMP